MKRFLIMTLAASLAALMGCGTGSRGERSKTHPAPQAQSQEQSIEPNASETRLSITVPTGIYLTPAAGRLIEVSEENEAIIKKVKNQLFKKSKLKREIARLLREPKALTLDEQEKFKQENQAIADEIKALEAKISAIAYDSFSFELFREKESESYQVRHVQWIQDEALMIDRMSEAVAVQYNEETGHLSFTVKDIKVEGQYRAERKDGFPLDVIYGQALISDEEGQLKYRGQWRAERQLTAEEEKDFLEKTAPAVVPAAPKKKN